MLCVNSEALHQPPRGSAELLPGGSETFGAFRLVLLAVSVSGSFPLPAEAACPLCEELAETGSGCTEQEVRPSVQLCADDGVSLQVHV